MSYCRWSCDDFQCDLYVYESCHGGFLTHVAKARVVFAEPLPAPVPLDAEHCQEWAARNRKLMEIMERSERVAIDLPHAGDCFCDETASACADRLESLRALGYRVPQYAIDNLRDEE